MWQYILRSHLFDPEFSLSGIILAVAFIQMKNKDKDKVESAQASEVKPLQNWIWKECLNLYTKFYFSNTTIYPTILLSTNMCTKIFYRYTFFSFNIL